MPLEQPCRKPRWMAWVKFTFMPPLQGVARSVGAAFQSIFSTRFVKTDIKSQRPGSLSQPAILMAYANPGRSRPMRRDVGGVKQHTRLGG